MTQTSTIPGTMPDLREIVRKAMKRKDWTAYRLIQELGGKVKPGTVYGFLRDDDPTDINSEYLGHIFDALGIRLEVPLR